MPEVSTLAHLEEEVYCEDGENFGFFYPITQESEAAAKAALLAGGGQKMRSSVKPRSRIPLENDICCT